MDIGAHSGSKRPYPFQDEASAKLSAPPSQCSQKPFQIHGFFRHGHRTVSTKYMQRTQQLKEDLLAADMHNHARLAWLTEWELPEEWIPENDSQLTVRGRFEHYELGRRYRRRYQHLFDDERSLLAPFVYFPVASSAEQRALESGLAFSLGAFSHTGDVALGTQKLTGVRPAQEDSYDPLTRFQKCDAWDDEMDDSELRYNRTAFTNMLTESVSQRLTVDFDARYDFSESKVATIWDACQALAAKEAWDDTDSWCSLLSEEDIMGFEYGEDVDNWYKYGYGSVESTALLPSHWLQSTFDAIDESMEQRQQGEEHLKARLLFAHSGALSPILTMLGVFEDDEALPVHEVKEDREWRLSEQMTMASHVALEVFDCGDDAMVRLLHNEHTELRIKGCDDVFCPMATLREVFQPQLGFDVAAYCQGM